MEETVSVTVEELGQFRRFVESGGGAGADWRGSWLVAQSMGLDFGTWVETFPTEARAGFADWRAAPAKHLDRLAKTVDLADIEAAGRDGYDLSEARAAVFSSLMVSDLLGGLKRGVQRSDEQDEMTLKFIELVGKLRAYFAANPDEKPEQIVTDDGRAALIELGMLDSDVDRFEGILADPETEIRPDDFRAYSLALVTQVLSGLVRELMPEGGSNGKESD
jgi:hypothetical protein